VILPDVNVLVYAYREDAPNHAAYRRWLLDAVDSMAPYGVSELVFSRFLRIVTHPRVFRPPTLPKEALEFTEALRSRPNCVPVSPGPCHWGTFTHLCMAAGAKGLIGATRWSSAGPPDWR
jgi:toxin-antitoxin system PIN domain toxin